jgi:hypothetical protein
LSSTAPAELSAAAVIQQIESGVVPREALLTFARGFLPLEQEDVIAVLAYLAISDDPEVGVLAGTTLGEMPPRTLIGVASNESTAPEHLARLARASRENSVLEALIRNRALDDATVEQLALRADAQLQEVIVINQARILRAPEILDALLSNPILSPEARRRAIETREEFFEKQAPVRAPLPPEDEELPDLSLPDDAIADLLEKADEEVPQAPPAIPTMFEDPTKQSVFFQIMNMSIKEKVQLAYRGGKTERMILVRDRNKLICTAAMRNPRVTDTEAEAIAAMRNVDDEVLRIIGTRRDWMAKLPIVNALVHNPKAPVGVVLPLINRLTLRDLKSLKDDKGVSEVVRVMARKLYTQRSQK